MQALDGSMAIEHPNREQFGFGGRSNTDENHVRMAKAQLVSNRLQGARPATTRRACNERVLAGSNRQLCHASACVVDPYRHNQVWFDLCGNAFQNLSIEAACQRRNIGQLLKHNARFRVDEGFPIDHLNDHCIAPPQRKPRSKRRQVFGTNANLRKVARIALLEEDPFVSRGPRGPWHLIATRCAKNRDDANRWAISDDPTPDFTRWRTWAEVVDFGKRRRAVDDDNHQRKRLNLSWRHLAALLECLGQQREQASVPGRVSGGNHRRDMRVPVDSSQAASAVVDWEYPCRADR